MPIRAAGGNAGTLTGSVSVGLIAHHGFSAGRAADAPCERYPMCGCAGGAFGMSARLTNMLNFPANFVWQC